MVTKGRTSRRRHESCRPRRQTFRLAVRRLTTSFCPLPMGSDPMAVVGADLRVQGLKGLRVIDASVMPRIVSGNTASPTVMIAEKAAEMILKPT